MTSGMFLEKINSLIEKGRVAPESRVVFVNDGSKDNTWNIIQELAKATSTSRASAFPATGVTRTLCWAV